MAAKPKITLALDQATRVSGWALFRDDVLIECGHWAHTATEIPVRIHNLCQQIEKKIKDCEVTLVVLENIQLEGNSGVTNVMTFQKLAWLQGAIMDLCQRMQIKSDLIYPTEWRAQCNFLKGNAKDRISQKKIAQQWVKDTYNMTCTQDEADAICLGFGYIKRDNSELSFE